MIVDKHAARAVTALIGAGIKRDIAQVIVARLYDTGCLLDDSAIAVISASRALMAVDDMPQPDGGDEIDVTVQMEELRISLKSYDICRSMVRNGSANGH